MSVDNLYWNLYTFIWGTHNFGPLCIYIYILIQLEEEMIMIDASKKFSVRLKGEHIANCKITQVTYEYLYRIFLFQLRQSLSECEVHILEHVQVILKSSSQRLMNFQKHYGYP
jgi:hypothetical protein